MRAESGNTFLCSYWPIYLKVTSFNAEGNSSKEKVIGEVILFPLPATSPVTREASTKNSKGSESGGNIAPCL